METVYVLRNDVTSECIRSLVIAKGEIFYFLERPWLDNQQGISCIPSGEYEAVYLERSNSGKYKNIYQIIGVPGRVGILDHNGNIVDHTRGCQIIGKRKGILAGKRAVLNSRTALGEFVDLMEKKTFKMIIIGGQHVRRSA